MIVNSRKNFQFMAGALAVLISSSIFLLCSSCGFNQVSLSDSDMNNMPPAKAEVNNIDSKSSSPTYLVKIMQVQNTKVGCIAVERRTSNPIFVSSNIDGSVGVSILDRAARQSADYNSISTQVTIGNKKYDKNMIFDGNLITISLQKSELPPAGTKTIIIGKQKIDVVVFQQLYDAAANCALHLDDQKQ